MMEEVVAVRQKYREIVSKLMTPGAIGMAVLLGSTAPGAASQQPSPAPGQGVSERLAAIREAVSAVSGAPAQASHTAGEQHLAWGNWRNGGWGGGGWGRPWGGYGYGIPYVAPWGNWRNGWNNWRNGWLNW